MPKITTSVRLDEEMQERLDAIAKAMADRVYGDPLTRSSAIRVAIQKGIEALEADLGLVKKRKR